MNQTVTPTTQSELARFVASNAAESKPKSLIPTGGRTALPFAYSSGNHNATEVSTAKLNRVVDYPARDMTITVEAGVTMDTLAETLKAEKQQLPIDIAQASRATLGGVLATNTSGPRRFGYGTMRDYVIGVSAVDATGRAFRAGGRVVKNVAGYDLCKLLVGSLGELAIVSQVTLKLKPIPETSGMVWLSIESLERVDSALEKLLTSETRPVAIEMLNPLAAQQIAAEAKVDVPTDKSVLCVMVEGTDRDVAWQSDTLTSELTELAASIQSLNHESSSKVLEALTEYCIGVDEPLTFRASMPPSRLIGFVEKATERGVATQSHAANGVVIGHFPDRVTNTSQASELVSELREHLVAHPSQAPGSQVGFTVLNCDSEWKPAFAPKLETIGSTALMQKIKHSLDPDCIFACGAMFGEWSVLEFIQG